MESIWLDLREHAQESPIPAEHKALLDERRRRVASGEAALHDWDEVKRSIGRTVIMPRVPKVWEGV